MLGCVLCLSGRLNVLCTKLCGPSALGNIKAGGLYIFFSAAAFVVPVFVVVVLAYFASLVVSGSCLLTFCGGVVSYNLFLL